jgi:hypothetical protein
MTVYTNSKGRGIGKLEGEIFRKTVSRKKHLMRKLNSWGIQADVLIDLGDNIRIEIFDKDEKTVYVTTAKEFREGGVTGNYGHGEQIFLSLDKFRKESPTASKLAAPVWN